MAMAKLEEDLPKTLAEMSDEAFKELVDDAIREQVSDETQQALAHPLVINRWYFTVLAAQQSAETQFASRRAETNAKKAELLTRQMMAKRAGRLSDAEKLKIEGQKEEQNFTRWKAGALRFKSGCEQQLILAKRAMAAMDPNPVIDRLTKERGQALARVAELEQAIKSHKASLEADSDPSEEDLELWNLIK